MKEQRLLQLFDKAPSGCWLWRGCKNRHGYGNVNSKTYGTKMAHRAVYARLVGTIPQGKEIDHLCRNRACVNPEHLEIVDHKTNCARGSRSFKTHCIHGHALTPENRYVYKNGKRECRTCRTWATRRYTARHRV